MPSTFEQKPLFMLPGRRSLPGILSRQADHGRCQGAEADDAFAVMKPFGAGLARQFTGLAPSRGRLVYFMPPSWAIALSLAATTGRRSFVAVSRGRRSFYLTNGTICLSDYNYGFL
jgi:hypothetical protein